MAVIIRVHRFIYAVIRKRWNENTRCILAYRHGGQSDNGINLPYRKGYTFMGWSVIEGGTTANYTMADIENNGYTQAYLTIDMLYAIWI